MQKSRRTIKNIKPRISRILEKSKDFSIRMIILGQSFNEF